MKRQGKNGRKVPPGVTPDPALYVIELSALRTHFLGPVVVLIGPETNSAAEDFVVPLHAAGRATIVGQKSRGSTGQPLRFSFLDGKIRGRVCTRRDTYPDGREFVGVGIIPDVEVHPSPADIAAGRDVVLGRGLEVLRAKIK